MGRQLGHQPPDIYKLEVRLAQSAVGVRPAHANVVIDPERDVAAEIASGKDAEESGLEIGGWDIGRNRPGRRQSIELITVAAGVLEVVVVAQPNRRDSRYGARPDSLGPQLRVRRSSQHHRGNLQHRLVVFGELEARILEGLTKVVKLGKVNVARAATGAVLSGKRGNSQTLLGRSDYEQDH